MFLLRSNACKWQGKAHTSASLLFCNAIRCAKSLSFFFFSSAPAFSFIYISGSVEIRNLTYTNDLNDPTSQKFLLQAKAIQNYVSSHISRAMFCKYFCRLRLGMRRALQSAIFFFSLETVSLKLAKALPVFRFRNAARQMGMCVLG